MGEQDKRGAVLLEDDQPDPVAALVGIRQQRQDRAFGGVHPLRDRHRPGSIHQEQNEIRHPFDADLALQVALFNGKGQPFAFFDAAFLERRRGAECGIEGDIIRLVAGGARLDIPSVFAVGLGQRTSARVFAG